MDGEALAKRARAKPEHRWVRGNRVGIRTWSARTDGDTFAYVHVPFMRGQRILYTVHYSSFGFSTPSPHTAHRRPGACTTTCAPASSVVRGQRPAVVPAAAHGTATTSLTDARHCSAPQQSHVRNWGNSPMDVAITYIDHSADSPGSLAWAHGRPEDGAE